MPIHNVGYRGWDGKRTPVWMRWWMITKTGAQIVGKSPWVKRALIAAWIPILYWGIVFVVVENAILQDYGTPDSIANKIDIVAEQAKDRLENDELIDRAQERIEDQLDQQFSHVHQAALEEVFEEMLAFVPQSSTILESLKSGDAQLIRKNTWRWLLMTFFRYPQALLIVFLIGGVAPVLISRDIRSRAFLLYFSKPIGRLEYIFGKLMIPAYYIAIVTTLPALTLYLIAVLLSPGPSVVLATWDIPLRIIVASLVLTIPVCSISLALSSLTQESRFANFSWFAVWLLGHGAYFSVVIATSIQLRKPPIDPLVYNNAVVRRWSPVSLYNCLGDAQEMVFGFQSLGNCWHSVLTLVAITAVSLLILYRRVSSPIRV